MVGAAGGGGGSSGLESESESESGSGMSGGRGLVFVVFVGVGVGFGGFCGEEWLGIMVGCGRLVWSPLFHCGRGSALDVLRECSLRLLCRCFSPAGQVWVFDEGGYWWLCV